MTDENNTDAISAPKTTRKPRTTKTTTQKDKETASPSSKAKTTKTATKPVAAAKATTKKAKTDSNATHDKAKANSSTKPKSKLSKSSASKVSDAQVESELVKGNADTKPNVVPSLNSKRTRSVRKTALKTASTEQVVVDEVVQDMTSEVSKPRAKPSSKLNAKTPRRVNKKSAQPPKDASSLVENVTALPILVHDDAVAGENVDVKSDITPDATHDEDNTSKSRRGRRGGRGKRGKKRPLKAMEDVVEQSPAPNRAKAAQATSVAEGKPGRARTTAGKKAAVSAKRRNMFISVVSGEQVEVALTEEGALHEYYLEMLHQMKTKGNIYKGVVHNVDTNLQAAFINYGAGKNGFLQIDEIHPEYYQQHHESSKGKKYPPIQQVIKPGQEILVQVLKEPTGSKGAFLTTWLSLAGRFLVLTPGQEQIGISRKVDSEEERARLRELMEGIEPGAGLGVIVRTVSVGTSKTTLKNDLQYLKRVWKEIRKRGVSEAAPLLVYQEPRLAERAIRDYLTDDVLEVWVDNAEMADSLREVVSLLFPRKKDLVRVHSDVRQTLWERFAVQRQLEQIYSREVVLPSGGRLVFDQTEALMAVDINSGKISGKGNFASMALKTNLEAAEAIARHLRLRDIGGQIVIDFIEMRDKSHVREVEKTLRAAMKSDRARHDMGRMSSFGLLEIVRQRTASSALAITMEPCPHCRGTGMRRNLEWQSLQSLREMMRQGRAAQGEQFVFEASPELALYLLNRKRQRISEIEEQLGKTIEVRMRA